MKEWWTARELAAERLPGLPIQRANIRLFAERERWRCRETRNHVGGARREYHLSSLPEAARLELERRAMLPVQMALTAAGPTKILPSAHGAPGEPATGHSYLVKHADGDQFMAAGFGPIGAAAPGGYPQAAGANPPSQARRPESIAAATLQPRPTNRADGRDAPGAIAAPEIEALWRAFWAAPETHRAEAQRRARVLGTVEEMVRSGMRRTDAYRAFAAAQGEGRCGSSTVQQWAARVRGLDRQHWAAALTPRWRAGGAFREYDERFYLRFRDLYLKRPGAPASKCYLLALKAVAAELRGEYDADSVPNPALVAPGEPSFADLALAFPASVAIPSRATLMRRIAREYTPMQIAHAREGERAVELMIPAQRRTVRDLRAMQIINGDGHICDWFVRWPDGAIARPILAAIADVYSRAIIGWRLGKTENVDLIRLVFGDAFEALGLPDEAYFDNGRAWISPKLSGGMKHRFRWRRLADEAFGECRGVLETLGVRVHNTWPYHGQSKPIERAWREVEEWLKADPRGAGAYTGNTPLNKPEDYGARAIPLDQFHAMMAAAIRHYNEAPKRRTEAARGVLSLRQAFEESYRANPIRRVAEEQRFLWLLASRPLRVRHDGSLSLYGNRYAAEALLHFAGREIVARFDPQRLHDGVRIYAADGRMVCEAPCIEDVGFADVESAREDMRSRRALIKAARIHDAAQERIAQARAPRAIDDSKSPAIVKPRAPQAGLSDAFARLEENLKRIPDREAV
jgi:putative transposase